MKFLDPLKLYFFKRGWFGEPLRIHATELKHVLAYGDEALAVPYVMSEQNVMYLLPEVGKWLAKVETRMTLFDEVTWTYMTIWFFNPDDAIQFKLTFL
jgi:hypothetical protein